MAYKVITRDKKQRGTLDNRRFNSLAQALAFIKSDVKQFTKGDFLRLCSEGVEASDGFKYKALYLDRYNRARVILWEIMEA